MPLWVRPLLTLAAAFALVVTGTAMVYLPAAFIVAGLFLLAEALL